MKIRRRALSFRIVVAALVMPVLMIGVFTSPAVASGGGISGIVTDASTGDGLGGVVVDLYDSSYNFVAETATNSDGTYSLPAQSGRTYEVEFATTG